MMFDFSKFTRRAKSMPRALAVSFAISALAVSAAVPAYAADVNFRLALITISPHPLNMAAEAFAEEVEKLSDGSMHVEIFPNRQLGDAKEVTEGVRFGTIDMAINSSSSLADQLPEIDALQLPFLFNSYEHFADVASSPEAQALYEGLGQYGAIGLGLYDSGERHLLTVNREATSAADLKGLRTRVVPESFYLDVFERFGVNPTPMAYAEVYTGLETGAIDAVDTNFGSIIAEKYYEVGENLLKSGHFFWPSLLMVNKARFDSLTPEQQDILRHAAETTSDAQIRSLTQYDADIEKQLGEEYGMAFQELSPEFEAELRETVEPVYEKLRQVSPKVGALIDRAEEAK